MTLANVNLVTMAPPVLHQVRVTMTLVSGLNYCCQCCHTQFIPRVMTILANLEGPADDMGWITFAPALLPLVEISVK